MVFTVFGDLFSSQLFDADEFVLGRRGPYQLIQLRLNGCTVPILGVLNDEHHQEGKDRGRRINDKLPSIRIIKYRTSCEPHNDQETRRNEGNRAAGLVGYCSRNSRKQLVHICSVPRSFLARSAALAFNDAKDLFAEGRIASLQKAALHRLSPHSLALMSSNLLGGHPCFLNHLVPASTCWDARSRHRTELAGHRWPLFIARREAPSSYKGGHRMLSAAAAYLVPRWNFWRDRVLLTRHSREDALGSWRPP